MGKKRILKLNKSERQYFTLVALISVLLLFFIIAIAKFLNIHKSTENISNTIGGIIGACFSFFGSILVYMALKSQVKANRLVQSQFRQQHEEQLFFKLVDTLHNRIVNYSFEVEDGKSSKKIASYDILIYIIKKFRNDMYASCPRYGRQLLSKTPQVIAVDFYIKINNLYYGLPGFDIEKAENLKSELIEMENSSERWEFIKMFFNSEAGQRPEQRDLLESIGAVYFYKTPYKDRYDMYQNIVRANYDLYGGFFNGYFNNFEYLMAFVDSIKENDFYINYLKVNLTQYEKAFLFYYLSSDKSSIQLKKLIKKYSLLSDLEFNSEFFVDAPTIHEFRKELESILEFDEDLLFNTKLK